MIELLVALLAFIGLGIAIHLWGFPKFSILLILFCAAVLPRNLTHQSVYRHVGIGPASPELTTYIVAVGALLLFALFRPRYRLGLMVWIPLIAWLAAGAALVWTGGEVQQSGILQLLLAPAAWVIGMNISSGLAADNGRFLVRLISSVIFLQLAVCILQWLGLDVNPLEANQEALLGSRFNGTLGHPNDLGKVIFLLLAAMLPFGRRVGGADAVLWRYAVGAGLVVLAMTGGRAVSAAAVCMLLIWALLSPARAAKRGRKAAFVGVALTAAAFLSGVLLSRFDEDPEGGARSTLTDVAWAQISSSPWLGVGPNSYVDVVGSYDALTASGVPVHNAFLLALAEIGIVGAASLLLPVVIGTLVALRRFRLNSDGGEASRVYLAALPGLYLVGTTGWGILGGYVLPLFALVFGLLHAWSSQRSNVEALSPIAA
ncbi:O-antigen ligase family protein [Arthrobacter sp. AL12]|uniref:O-antigen ligase family protein n=1 Tax=Arthrobacter sp. AL12 TaxID=3042241 RepID=UPI00249BB21B|nr:O-antigen ligase family protein [Arthrobacter sp. AL12]MDI3213095.1 O-antigen ligase family protein [Arthrobacter sp. AL12]